MRRRAFVRGLCAAVALEPLRVTSVGSASSGSRRLARIGIQLYTLRDAASKDLERTLADIAAIGYDDVELLGSLGNYGHSPARVRAILDRVGLRAPSSHVSAGHLTVNLERHLESAKSLGHSYLIVAGFRADEAATLDDYLAWADHLNRAAEVARRYGIWLGFHNHASDFEPKNGMVPYDAFVERTDAAALRHQLDVGNLAATGRDPKDYLARFGRRYWSFHIKDPAKPPGAGDADLGTGRLDFAAILSRIERLGEKHIFAEQETYPGSPLESARRNYAYLKALEF